MTVNSAIKHLIALRDKHNMGDDELVIEIDNEDVQIPILSIGTNTFNSSNELYDYPVILISKEEL